MAHRDETHWRRHGSIGWNGPGTARSMGVRGPTLTTCDACGWTWRTGWQEPACTCTLPRQRVPFPEVEPTPAPAAMGDELYQRWTETYADRTAKCSCGAHVFYTLLAVAFVAVLAKFQGWI